MLSHRRIVPECCSLLGMSLTFDRVILLLAAMDWARDPQLVLRIFGFEFANPSCFLDTSDSKENKKFLRHLCYGGSCLDDNC